MYSLQSSTGFLARAALAGCLILGLTAAAALAQNTTSTLTGEIRDANGAALNNVQVTARHVETGLTRTIISTGDGRFVFPGLPLGVYEITAELAGFQKLIHKDATLTVGETLSLSLTMIVASVTADVEVTGGEALVNTQSQELSYLVNERAIKELPLNGRNYTDLASLQPGVIPFPNRDGGSVVAHGLGMSINGQDPRSNVYLLDGTPQNDFTNGPAGSAAGTALGIETIREFRVETNAYSAEYGRNSGGQINVVSKSGGNSFNGSLYHFHRNDNLDARNFFDGAKKPEFKRNQFGASLGGPVKQDKLFFFAGYEGLRENLGRTISTVVPDLNARNGIIPGGNVTVNPLVRPYLDAFPLPNGPGLGGGLASYSFGFNQQVNQDFVQTRFDYNRNARDQFFARYTFDDADQRLPTDFPQFPRSFLSRNQFFTGEYRQSFSPNTLNTFRIGYSRTRIGQDVEADVSQGLQPFVPGRTMIGDIDIGGLPRFGPQSSVNLRLTQNVYNFEYGMVHSRGRHLIKAGALAEHYRDNMYNPTFSLGIFTFSGIRDFLLNRPQRFIGLTPEGALDRHWRFTLFGFYGQDTYRVNERLSLNLGLRYEFATMPEDTGGRDSTLINLTDAVPTVGPLYRNPTFKNISPRVGFAWDVFGDGRTSVRGGYGVYFNTNNQQNLIVTVTNPPATPRPVVNNPTFPVPSFTGSLSVRPVQYDLDNPYVQVWNLNVQRELWFDTVLMFGYAGSRGVHLLRSNDVNVPTPQLLSDGTVFYPPGQLRPNTAFTAIELKSSDGNSWYNAMIVELRKRWSHGLSFQSSYTLSRNIDTTQASTFFSDATNGTTSAFPEPFGLNYNKGLADFHAKHTWVSNFIWEIPFARKMGGVAGKILHGWQLAGIAQMRSGNPLTVFVQRNRSRSQWSPSLGPGIGQDRPSFAPGFTHETAVTGDPNHYFNPAAFVLQPAGTLGNVGRGSLIGPNLRTFDLSLIKNTRWSRLGERTNIQLRIEAFNIFNRTNFGPPLLTAFTGAADNEQPVSTFGLIRSTATSARQIQLGLRVTF
ncbi:MAG TPA: TonB-dependent receptor [Pyrinomonadaceae bacterium]|jgi:outer membrane receptor protein involved in Fe transport